MINAYCVDEIIIWKWNGYDSWGEPYSGSLCDLKGYVTWKTRLIRNLQGEEVLSSVSVLLSKKKILSILGRDLAHEDRVQIGGESFDRAIIDFRTPKAFSTNVSKFGVFYEVYLA